MSASISGRALHWVFKVGNRKETIRFYRDVLGMKVLRHEEFEEGCKASCNGPYDGKWSKTMVGYGPEDTHFVVELTYNYGIGSYNPGNDFLGITIKSSEAIKNAENLKWPMTEEGVLKCVQAPGGYKFFLMNETQPLDSDPVQKVSIASSNLQTSIEYWSQLLGMQTLSSKQTSAELTYGQTSLELIKTDSINHGTAFGRIAFAVETNQLPKIQAAVESKGFNVLTPLVKLDTPGKATVEVVILADPDGHEICFVGDEAFKELSQPDPKGDVLLDEAMEKDKSEEWFAKKGKTKGIA